MHNTKKWVKYSNKKILIPDKTGHNSLTNNHPQKSETKYIQQTSAT
jgi:hypothetical protein